MNVCSVILCMLDDHQSNETRMIWPFTAFLMPIKLATSSNDHSVSFFFATCLHLGILYTRLVTNKISFWDTIKIYNKIKCRTIKYKTFKYKTIKHNTIKYNTIKYNTINTIQLNTIQLNTIQLNTIQLNTIQ